MRFRRTAVAVAGCTAAFVVLVGLRAQPGDDGAAPPIQGPAPAADRHAAPAGAAAAFPTSTVDDAVRRDIAPPPVERAIPIRADEGPAAPAGAPHATEGGSAPHATLAVPPPRSRAGAALARALAEAEAGSWSGAEDAARTTGDTVAADLVVWLRLQDGVGTWSEHRRFLARNPDWPSLTPIRRMAEYAMPATLAPLGVLGVFRGGAPLTGRGALRHADALSAVGRSEDAAAEIARAWRTLSIAPADQTAILARYGEVVAPLHVERIDMLLWRGLTGEATGMLPLVPADWRALAEARIAVRRDANGSTAAIQAVPAALRSHPGLAFERYLYRVEKGLWDEAEAYLLERSTSAEALGEPDMWMERRANLARAALRRGEVETAYALAANNFGTKDSGADYADAEWVAGYVALTRMDDPARAVGHFERFQAAVATPISLGRAGYWLGRARFEAGDAAAAEAAWRAGAMHQTSFYGQLAAERAGVPADARLAGETEAPDWRSEALDASSALRAARLLRQAGDDARAALFFRHAADGMPAPQRAAVAQMAADLGAPHLGVRIAKDAAADGVLLPSQYYPLHAMAEADWPVPTELALAIARQESEFNPGAVSPAGARGLMQLMPATAQEVSGQLGVGYDLGRLTADPMYNARLGTAYLARMLRAYDGSYVLAAAAYNAGPGRVREWLAAYGDPRSGEIDAIDWMETIPFEETRNYVMRVLESLHVYRARLEGETPPIRLASDIHQAT
jgi:soluble lytic murein transglycosylase